MKEIMSAMRKKRKDVTQTCLYMGLPDGSVPKEVLDGKMAIERVEILMTETLSSGHRHRIFVRRSPHLRLYTINRPLEEIKVQQETMMRELLDLRSRLMLIAVRLNLKNRVPSLRNGLPWLQLADLIQVRLVQLQTFVITGKYLSDEAPVSLVLKKGN